MKILDLQIYVLMIKVFLSNNIFENALMFGIILTLIHNIGTCKGKYAKNH